MDVDAVDVGGVGAGEGEGAKGSAEGVEEGFAGGVGNHVRRCEETGGGTDDTLDAYIDQLLKIDET